MTGLSTGSLHKALSTSALFVVLGVVAGISSPSSAETWPLVQNVDITKSAFVPREITVAPGTKIVWTNHDEMPHTVTGGDKSFASKGLDTDDKFAHTFSDEGDFDYRCTVHPYMTGVVHVRK
jgi:plastocyanin